MYETYLDIGGGVPVIHNINFTCHCYSCSTSPLFWTPFGLPLFPDPPVWAQLLSVVHPSRCKIKRIVHSEARVRMTKDVKQQNTSPLYSWIGHRLQTGLTLAFLLWLSDFKTKTSFGFLSPNYTGHVFWFFSKNLKMSSFRRFWCFWQF